MDAASEDTAAPDLAAREVLWLGESPSPGAADRLDPAGDLWHSGLQRGTSGLLWELCYWQPVYWFYLDDGPGGRRSVSWRVDPTGFAIRRAAWERLGGMDPVYRGETTRALDFGFRLLRSGGIPLHLPGAWESTEGSAEIAPVERLDLYLFFCRNFKREYRLYLWLREAYRRRRPLSEWRLLKQAEQLARSTPAPPMRLIPPRALEELSGPLPRISAVVPTAGRQQLTRQLIFDLGAQTVPLHEIVVVDQTPEAERDDSYADLPDLPVTIRWATTRGSCRARNEAIAISTGEYILFADDDTRLPPDCVENHLRLLETYQGDATNGLDIRADHPDQDLADLDRKVSRLADRFERIGVDHRFSNANSFVRRSWVERVGGNDLNFEGGYGEDTDFGQCLVELGAVILFNPYSANLHLKPAFGGYRWWDRRRRGERQPWEMNRRVRWVGPKPSPTILYGFKKHYGVRNLREWKWLYLLRTWWPTRRRPDESTAIRLLKLPWRLAATPVSILRMRRAGQFSDDLVGLGPRYH